MKLIIAEKPSVAQTIAHSLGANEKIHADKGSAFCYSGNGYYVAYAAGHLYGIGEPKDYGYEKWKEEDLPFFPDFKIHPLDKTENLRDFLKVMINKEDVTELICATDAGREGELIFRHIYNANNCTKPVKRLWVSSYTDEAIRTAMDNLKPSSEYDNMYKAAFTRQKLDWLFGMNLSRLYGIADNYPHKIGRVKTPLLSIIAERDKEISEFVPHTTYKLKLANGAQSTNAFEERAEAEKYVGNEKKVTVTKAETTEKRENRPLLFSLDTLQQAANDAYGMTAAETLETAQSLYEKKLTTYPRTDSNYLSDDMIPKLQELTSFLRDNISKVSERAKNVLDNGLNLDKRIIDNTKISDHHAIIITGETPNFSQLTENEKNVYYLVANRLLSTMDKPYIYNETKYEFWCDDISYTLTGRVPVQLGWKAYNKKPDDVQIPSYSENDVFDTDITLHECISKPKAHYTDKTLLSVMNNIDNRLCTDDEALKEAVSGKGIGTPATRAGIIEELIKAGYIAREKKNLVVTDFGRDFINSLPNNLKSVERTAEWEAELAKIQSEGASADGLYGDVKALINTTVTFEKSNNRAPIKTPRNNSNGICSCPRCAAKGIEEQIVDKGKFYGCTSYKSDNNKGCGFALWKNLRGIKSTITDKQAEALITGKAVKLTAVSKENKEYTAEFRLEDTGEYINLVREKTERQIIGKCPRCKKNGCEKNIYEGKSSFYCESGRDGCGFTLWKEDKFNGVTVTAKNAEELLSKGKTVIKKKTVNGSISIEFTLKDTGKYINLVKDDN